uniref:Uncharacterized protein n=1 Tax=Podoviridae sp. ctz6O13 TaxID=2827757 RepID=A0A8S5TL28_9CAUD|nr:MAG TPA: hypothetical protein [Podoviridae sp. ctz6O13]
MPNRLSCGYKIPHESGALLEVKICEDMKQVKDIV